MAARLSDERVGVLDVEAVRLARSKIRLRLRIGEGLEELLRRSLHQRELGFSSIEGYAKEECGQSGRWVVETRTVARRLSALPHVRAALGAGRIGWCMAELLARHATPETEEALLEQACRSSVRAMRARFRAAKSDKGDGGGGGAGAISGATTKQGEDGEGAAKSHREEGDEEDDPYVEVRITLPKEDAPIFEMTKQGLDHLAATRTDASRMDVLVSEGFTTMINAGVDPDVLAADVGEKYAQRRAKRAREEAERDAAEQEAEATVCAQPAPDAGEAPEEPLPEDPYELAARIRQGCAELASRELFFGRVVEPLLQARGWKRLGYASEGQYARERLGMSRASMRGHVTLARRLKGLFATCRALQDGEIGVVAARLIARVSTPATEALWVERAQRRTFKHLQEEVQAVEMLARVSGDPDALVPPSEDELDRIFEFERKTLTGALIRKVLSEAGYAETKNGDVVHMSAIFRPVYVGDQAAANANGAQGQMSASAEVASGDVAMAANGEMAPSSQMSASAEVGGGTPGAGQMSAFPDRSTGERRSAVDDDTPRGAIEIDATDEDVEDLLALPDVVRDQRLRRLGTVRYRLRVRESVAEELRRLEAAHKRGGLPGRFFRYLCLTFLQTWVPYFHKPLKWGEIYERDRFRCTSPVCLRRDCKAHHMKYRSQGGGDEDGNLTGACDPCHLLNIHEYGSVRVFPPASDITWVFGRRPFMEVRGREKRRIAG